MTPFNIQPTYFNIQIVFLRYIRFNFKNGGAGFASPSFGRAKGGPFRNTS